MKKTKPQHTTTYGTQQNTVLRGKLIAINTLKKQFSDLMPNFTAKELENEEQTKPNISRRRKIISIRPETNELENLKKYIGNIKENKS